MNIIPLRVATNTEGVGYTAANLSVALRATEAVPDGIVLPVHSTMTTIEEAITRVEELGLHFPLIVRSSATIDEGVLVEFQNQFLSVFPVNTIQELSKAVREVLGSMNSARLQQQCAEYNMTVEDLHIAILIQEYKQPQWSGVAFDMHDSHTCIIEASRIQNGIVESTPKPVYIILNTTDGSIIHGRSSALPQVVIRQLLSIIAKMHSVSQYPQDIEWVFDSEKVWITQTRASSTRPIDIEECIMQEQHRLQAEHGTTSPLLTAFSFPHDTDQQSILPIFRSIFSKIFPLVDVCGRTYIRATEEEQKVRFQKIQHQLQARRRKKEIEAQIAALKNIEYAPEDVSIENLQEQIDHFVHMTTPLFIEILSYEEYGKPWNTLRKTTQQQWELEYKNIADVLRILDKKMKLYNTIWFLTIDELTEQYPNYDRAELIRRKNIYTILTQVVLPKKINAYHWENIRLPQ